MSSGHTGRSGRGNRRARRGPQRPRGPEGQSGQPRQNTAMLLVSQPGRQSAHAPRNEDEQLPEDERDVDAQSNDVDLQDDAEVAESAASSDEAIAAADERSLDVEHTHSAHERAERQGGEPGTPASAGLRPEKRGPMLVPPGNVPHGPVPYAPGSRTHMAPPDTGAQSAQSGQSSAEAVARVAPAPARSTRLDRDRDHGEHEPLHPEVRGEVGPLIDSLHDVFIQDRSVASQGGTTRCGICYLHFPIAELEYRDAEGYYVCARCARALGHTRLPMVRRQQRS